MNDPFAAADAQTEAPAEENQTTTQPETKKETKTVTVEAQENQDLSITLKGGSGYDAPWIVIRANSVAEAQQHLEDEGLKTLIDQTKKVANYFSGGGQAKGGPKGQPQAAQEAPNGQQAPEGYVFKSGVSKEGKAWKAFMPIDRNSNLQPIWL